MLKIFFSCMFFVLIANSSCAQELYPFTAKKQEVQFQYLLKELRCPVCQNQDLADSNADVAKDLRQQVYIMVLDNKTDEEIIQHLTARFGDFILFKPQLKVVTYFLWFGPVIFILLGMLVFIKSIKRKLDVLRP